MQDAAAMKKQKKKMETTITRSFRLSKDIDAALRDLAAREYGGQMTMALQMTLVKALRLRHLAPASAAQK